jgi:Acetyl-coenzyme A synthetase N-terminus
MGYRTAFENSIDDPAGFWGQAAQAVTWIREPRHVFDDSNPPFYRWFADGELNTCANARWTGMWPTAAPSSSCAWVRPSRFE